MSSGAKVVIIIVVIGLLGIASLVGVGLVAAKSSVAVLEEANAFAANASKAMCLEESVKKMGNENSAGKLLKASMFGGACMEIAKGELDGYCEGKKVANPLPEDYCEPYRANKLCPQLVEGILINYCQRQ